MRTPTVFVVACAVLQLFVGVPQSPAEDANRQKSTVEESEFRTWTDHIGRTARARLVAFDGTTAILKSEGGKTYDVPATRLSTQEQKRLSDLLASRNMDAAFSTTLVLHQQQPTQAENSRNKFLQLLDDEDIQLAMKQLKGKMTKTVMEDRIVTTTVMVRVCVPCGPLGLRRKTVMLPRTIEQRSQVAGQVTSGVEFSWDTITDPSKGYGDTLISFVKLPKSVGAKSEFILTQLNTVMPTPYEHGIGQKSVTARNTNFVTFPDANTKVLIAVMIKIQGQLDQELIIVAAVQKQEGSGALTEKERDTIAATFVGNLTKSLQELANG